MRKLLILLLVLLFPSLHLQAQGERDGFNAINFETKDGKIVSFMIDENTKVWFSPWSYIRILRNDNWEYSWEGEEERVEKPNVESIFYSYIDDYTSVEDAKACNSAIISWRSIKVTNSTKPTTITICTADGKVMLKSTVKAGEKREVSLESLFPGIYIININGVTTKMTKR